MGLTPVPGDGNKADFTVFRLDDVEEEVMDSLGNTIVMRRMFEPVATVIGARHAPAARRTA
jgi:dihydroorotase